MTAAVEKSVQALVAIDRHNIYSNIENDLSYVMHAAFEKDNGYTLFRTEDWLAWTTFTVAFVVLILFDNLWLNRNPKAMSFSTAVRYTVFWVAMAFAFNVWVGWYYSTAHAFMWASGYMLQWMLSFDNLFVFHMIFTMYRTPDHLKHRPLFVGICGAVLFQLTFIFIGEYLMHNLFFMHFLFGGFLVYTGVKTMAVDDEDEDPSEQALVQWIQKTFPFVSVYDESGAFFVRVPINENGDMALPPKTSHQPTETDALTGSEAEAQYGAADVRVFALQSGDKRKTEVRATMLFMVVCCLEISDLLFAVDSVSAIVAQVPDLFLAYTSAIFAMLGLRAMFFIVDALVHMFTLLKYGVAAVLMFIGVKLIIGTYFHIPASVVCFVLVGSIASSMLASYIQTEAEKRQEGKMSPTVQEKVARLLEDNAVPVEGFNNPVVKLSA